MRVCATALCLYAAACAEAAGPSQQPASTRVIDLADPSTSLKFWLQHPSLGEASFDSFEQSVNNPIYTGGEKWPWPVNGFLAGSLRNKPCTIYVGLYRKGYEQGTTACNYTDGATTPPTLSGDSGGGRSGGGGGFGGGRVGGQMHRNTPPPPPPPPPPTPAGDTWQIFAHTSSSFEVCPLKGNAVYPYLGNTDTYQGCQAKCQAMQSGCTKKNTSTSTSTSTSTNTCCYSFSWADASMGEWGTRCYGQLTNRWKLTPNIVGVTSGCDASIAGNCASAPPPPPPPPRAPACATAMLKLQSNDHGVTWGPAAGGPATSNPLVCNGNTSSFDKGSGCPDGSATNDASNVSAGVHLLWDWNADLGDSNCPHAGLGYSHAPVGKGCLVRNTSASPFLPRICSRTLVGCAVPH